MNAGENDKDKYFSDFCRKMPCNGMMKRMMEQPRSGFCCLDSEMMNRMMAGCCRGQDQPTENAPSPNKENIPN
ncbi:MAG: hypothetical protein HQK58_03145 [Deltaproteobacteria bacterium]|nr:hypothetical protein [Deltaproteobacteria bacterium]